jgi:hypothetical protein
MEVSRETTLQAAERTLAGGVGNWGEDWQKYSSFKLLSVQHVGGSILQYVQTLQPSIKSANEAFNWLLQNPGQIV